MDSEGLFLFLIANLVSSSPYGFSVQEESRNLLSQTLFYKNVSGLYINIVVFFIFEDSLILQR